MSEAGDVTGQEDPRLIRNDDKDLVSPQIVSPSLLMSGLIAKTAADPFKTVTFEIQCDKKSKMSEMLHCCHPMTFPGS